MGREGCGGGGGGGGGGEWVERAVQCRVDVDMPA